MIDKFTIEDLSNSTLKSIYQYWLDRKGEYLVSPHPDLGEDGIGRFLPHINIITVENNPDRYKMSVIGDATVKAMGIDMVGRYLDDFPFINSLLKRQYDWLVTEKRPYLNHDKLKWSKKSFLEYYALGLPLSGNGTDVDMLMIGIYYQFPEESRTEFYDLNS